MPLGKRMNELTLEEAGEIAKMLSYCAGVALKLRFSKDHLESTFRAFADALELRSKPLEHFAGFDHSKNNLTQEKLEEFKDIANGKDWTDF